MSEPACSTCEDEGFVLDHGQGCYAAGECIGDCPVQVLCKCQITTVEDDPDDPF